MSRTWEDNAHEFGALARQGRDVRLALLVACSVERVGQGKGANAPFKLTATEFAKKAGTSKDRVLRHIDAWDKAAAKGWCKASSTLTPADADSIKVKTPTETDFKSVFTSDGEKPSGGRPRSPIKEIVAKVEEDPTYAEELVKAVTEAAPKTVADRIVKTPKGRKALQEAEDEHSEKVARYKKASQDAKKEDKKKTPFSFAIVDGALTQAKRSLTEALKDAEGVQFDAEEQDLLSHDLDQIAALLNLIRLRVAGNVEVDWDAELTKLTEA